MVTMGIVLVHMYPPYINEIDRLILYGFRLAGEGVEGCVKRLPRHASRVPAHDSAPVEQDHRWESADVVPVGQGLGGIHVDFGDLHTSVEVLGYGFDDRRSGTEGGAPGCPEFYSNGNVEPLQHFGIEVLFCQLNDV